jgi:hypothetical protein
MAKLDALLEEAKKADPGDRIRFRDPIASHGLEAIPHMEGWLGEPRLGAFAVRVLERIGAEPPNRGAVVRTLNQARGGELSEPVRNDIEMALVRLGGTRTRAPISTSRSASTPEQWPGSRSVSPLEVRFHDDMLAIFTLAGEATRKRAADGSTIRGYWASYILRGVRNHGGPAYAHQLLRAEGTSDGFQRLTDEHRLDLTVEALVLRPDYASLFTDEERSIAANRLARAGYKPPADRAG